MEERFQVGVITSTHGIKGEVKVFPTTDNVKRFKKNMEIILDTGKEDILLTVESVKFFKQFVILKFKGIDNINDVEKYKGYDLLIEVDGSDDEDYYYYELEGCNVYYNDELVGVVSEILETEAHEILRIKRKGLDDVLIPYVERFIVDVDVDEKRIDIDVIEGML